MEVINVLAADTPLPRRNLDHPLTGEWNDHRDCHIRPDLVSIYRKPDDDSLELVRIGSHSELGLCSTACACLDGRPRPWQPGSPAQGRRVRPDLIRK